MSSELSIWIMGMSFIIVFLLLKQVMLYVFARHNIPLEVYRVFLGLTIANFILLVVLFIHLVLYQYILPFIGGDLAKWLQSAIGWNLGLQCLSIVLFIGGFIQFGNKILDSLTGYLQKKMKIAFAGFWGIIVGISCTSILNILEFFGMDSFSTGRYVVTLISYSIVILGLLLVNYCWREPGKFIGTTWKNAVRDVLIINRSSQQTVFHAIVTATKPTGDSGAHSYVLEPVFSQEASQMLSGSILGMDNIFKVITEAKESSGVNQIEFEGKIVYLAHTPSMVFCIMAEKEIDVIQQIVQVIKDEWENYSLTNAIPTIDFESKVYPIIQDIANRTIINSGGQR